LRAYGTGSLEAAKQTGLELRKRWLSALDDRVRDSHRKVHGETIPYEDDFELVGGSGPGPGLIEGDDEEGEVINCRCTLVYGEDLELTRAVAEVAKVAVVPGIREVDE